MIFADGHERQTGRGGSTARSRQAGAGRRALRALPFIVSAALAAPGSLASHKLPGKVGARPSLSSDTAPQAEIVRSEYGVAHIKGDTLRDVAFGVGFTAAQDHVCVLADQFVRVRSERSRRFGADALNALHPHLVSDFGFLALGLYRTAQALWSKLSPQSQAMIEGYTAGYNRYLDETPRAQRPSACRDSPTLVPITPPDLFAYHLLVAREASGNQFLAAAYLAAPPGAPLFSSGGTLPPPVPEKKAIKLPWPKIRKDLGSNGFAIGERYVRDGAILVGTPHFPYRGNLRFHEYHLQIPGQLNARGVALLGFPVPNIGFNEQVAWTHTVATSEHFIVYRLNLDPNDPTRYLIDGVSEPMSTDSVQLEVKRPGGGSVTLEKKLYRSRFGSIIEIPGKLDWSANHAYALKDANESVTDMVDQWLGYAGARSLDDLVAAARRFRSNPWSNTIAAARNGQVFYSDFSRVPALDPATERALADDPYLSALRRLAGFTILPGVSANGGLLSPNNGLVQAAQAPQLLRSDFVANFNNAPWLTNPNTPLSGYSQMFGPAQAPLSLRAQRGLSLVEDLVHRRDGVSLPDVRAMLFDDDSQLAKRILPDLLGLCTGSTDPALVSACSALRIWDGRFDLNSRGAHLFREFAHRFQRAPAYAVPFSADAPLSTPSGLNRARTAEILTALREAAAALAQHGIALDAPLAAVQFFPYFDPNGRLARQPWAGGNNDVGTFTIADNAHPGDDAPLPEPAYPMVDEETGLTAYGHQIGFGTSYMQLVGFTRHGVEAYGLLSYSQSSHADSPHYADQSRLYRDKQLRPLSLGWPTKGLRKILRGNTEAAASGSRAQSRPRP